MVNGRTEVKHLDKVSDKPDEPKEGIPRVYGTKFDPLTQRLKLVLAAKNIEYESVNINLQSMPSWFLSKNPRGKVPVVQINSDIICDSIVASQYVDEVCSGDKLISTDSLKKAKELMLLQDCEKVVSGFRDAVLLVEEKPGIGMITMKEGMEFIDRFLASNKTEFVCGDQPGFVDFMIWPYLERIGAMWPLCITQYTYVEAYVNRMGSNATVEACRIPDSLHRKYISNIRQKVYDYELTEEADE